MTDRSGAIAISWGGDGVGLIGSVKLDGVTFARVEWSEKRGQWCIEDAAGQCLRHTASIKGQAAAKEEAVALAIAMVRDGRMPDPDTAHAEHRARAKAAKEKKAKQPAEIAKRAAKKALDDASTKSLHVEWEAKEADKEAGPLYEALASAFDFADPALWQSNSFAMLRPRLVIHLRAVVAKLEQKLAYERRRSPNPFTMYATSAEDRKELAAGRKAEIAGAIGAIEGPLARAREIMALLVSTERGEAGP